MKIVAKNKRAYSLYNVLEKYQAGLSLLGTEVKSIKSGRVSLTGSFILPRGGELFLIGAKIPPWQESNAPSNYNPDRPRKLLLKREEINYILGKSKQKGLVLIPLCLFLKGKRGVVKLEFALAKRLKKYQKKEKLKQKSIKKEIDQVIKTQMY